MKASMGYYQRKRLPCDLVKILLKERALSPETASIVCRNRKKLISHECCKRLRRKGWLS